MTNPQNRQEVRPEQPPGLSQGHVGLAFTTVGHAFDAICASEPHVGRALCVYQDGVPVVDLWAGEPYRQESLQVCWSSTKGIAAICIGALVDAGKLSLDLPVAEYWPEFGQAGKSAVTVRQLLSHQAGVPAFDSVLDAREWARGEAELAIAAQAPYWVPGTSHGYHAITFGTCVTALVRRVADSSVGSFLGARIRGPVAAEFWIGLPPDLDERVVPLAVPADEWGRTEEVRELVRRDESMLAQVLKCAPWIADASLMNDRHMHRLELPAANGIGSARGLARLYAACVGPVDGVSLISTDVLAQITKTQARGRDRVLDQESHFGVGFQLPTATNRMLGPGSFGHDGRGGTLGFGHIATRLGFGYITNRMPGRDGNRDDLDSLLVAIERSLIAT